jgi:hypothetical protein
VRLRLLLPLAAVFLGGCTRAPRVEVARERTPKVTVTREVVLPDNVALTYSQDRDRIAYQIEAPKGRRVVIDGREEREYEAVTLVLFSSTGQHAFYGGQRDQKWYLVRDGAEVAELGSLTNLSRADRMPQTLGDEQGYSMFFSTPLASWFAAKAENYMTIGYDGDGRFFKDGQWLPLKFSSFQLGGIAISPDGRHYCAAVTPAGDSRTTLFVDGEPGPTGDTFEDAAYLEPNDSLVYRVSHGHDWTMVVNGAPLSGHGSPMGNLEISGDNRHWAALVRTPGGKQAVVVDGAEEPAFSKVFWREGGPPSPFTTRDIGSFAWNAGATAHAYVASLGNDPKGPKGVVVNGKIVDRAAAMREQSVALSDDGNVAAYVVKLGKQYGLAVNGAVWGRYSEIMDPVFPGGWKTPVYAANSGDGWTVWGLAEPLSYSKMGPLAAGGQGRVAFAAKVQSGGWQVFVNGKPIAKAYEGIMAFPPLRFRENELSFLAKDGKKLMSVKVVF